MNKYAELKAAREKIQEELKGKTLLRVNYSAFKKDDITYLPNAMFFLQAGWYRDEPFHCIDCCVLQIWSATQQKWWYEVAKGSVLSTANRCRKCRLVYRKKAEEHRVRTRAGLTKKSHPQGG